jgi:PilZ domain
MVAESPAIVPAVDWLERRAVTRQTVNRGGAKLIWRVSPSRYSRSVGRLVDISEKGAAILSDTTPGHEDILWLGLEELPWEWVRANIRATGRSEGQWCFHVEFAEPCPPGLLEIASGICVCELILMWNPE